MAVGRCPRTFSARGIRSGAKVLAATGVLDRHRATPHWSGLDGLREAKPEVTWVGGQRWVQDGEVTTTAGVTSGIPGSLAVVRQMAGAAEASRVGEALAYPGWELDGTPDIPQERFTAGDRSLALGATLPWLRPDVAIGLTDGVGKIDVAARWRSTPCPRRPGRSPWRPPPPSPPATALS
jgi:transcriptional regulator GlxA family with amidase domain